MINNHNYKKAKVLIFIIILLFLNLVPLRVAKSQRDSIDEIITASRVTTGTAAGYNTGIRDPIALRAIYLQFFLSFLGVIFLILIVYGGFAWMTARGNEEEVSKAKSIMINATIGLVVILASYAISSYIINSLVNTI